VGFFDRFKGAFEGRREGRLVKEARERELGGDLGAAVTLYTEAGLADDAARVLLLRADAEPSAEKRLAFCAAAAAAAKSPELVQRARARKALLAFDTLRGRGGSFLASEVLAVAKDLEDAGELERAADAYALAGDGDAEVRALTAAGAIEKLEERLRTSEREARARRDLEGSLRRIADLDRTAERKAALEAARAALAASDPGDDSRIADAARAVRAKILRGPVIDVEIAGRAVRAALGEEVTIGRGDATIVIASRAVSRRHLRLARGPEGPIVEDLGTRNGTTLAGARLSGSIPVGAGVSLLLGNEVPVVIAPDAGGGVTVDVGGSTYLAPLGELAVGALRVAFAPAGDDPFVVLRTPPGVSHPCLGAFELAPSVELAHGDEIHETRGGPLLLRVPQARPADDPTQPGSDFPL
jgi:pSer/pThr/pTyr-binding forkhead associated (FHA) protein